MSIPYLCHITHTESGHTIKKGPRRPWCRCSICRKAAVWIVLPSPAVRIFRETWWDGRTDDSEKRGEIVSTCVNVK